MGFGTVGRKVIFNFNRCGTPMNANVGGLNVLLLVNRVKFGIGEADVLRSARFLQNKMQLFAVWWLGLPDLQCCIAMLLDRRFLVENLG
jgi:hypothetical protein